MLNVRCFPFYFSARNVSAIRSNRDARDAFNKTTSPGFKKFFTARTAASTSENSITRVNPASRAAFAVAADIFPTVNN